MMGIFKYVKSKNKQLNFAEILSNVQLSVTHNLIEISFHEFLQTYLNDYTEKLKSEKYRLLIQVTPSTDKVIISFI